MAATTYTGNSSTQVISNAVNSVGMQPDLVWVKDRNTARSHYLANSIIGGGNYLSSDSTNAEAITAAGITSFDASGFTTSTALLLNNTGETYVGWQWKAGGTAVSNTAGTITSSVSANTTAGFSVVTYTGTGANATVGHGLGVAPQFIIVKSRSSAVYSWIVYHGSLTSADYYITLNAGNSEGSATGMWNSTAPSSTVFSIGTQGAVNTASDTYVAYCWAPVAGYSSFGKYTGNGSADGPFIYTGFRPRWIMIKYRSNTGTGNWRVLDTSRSTSNVESLNLRPDGSQAEATLNALDGLSNGFKLRTLDTNYNESNGVYIYVAYAENPLKYANAR